MRASVQPLTHLEATFQNQADPSLRSIRNAEVRAIDEVLVERILAGDNAAEEQLYRRYAADLLRLSTRLLRSRDEADDLVQDTFVKAFEELSTLRDRSSVRNWLIQIAVRFAYRRFRRQKFLRWVGIETARDPEDADMTRQASPGPSPEHHAEVALLDRAVAQGAPEDRAAWILHRVEGFGMAEVADITKCSLSTVKRRISCMDSLVARHTECSSGPGVDLEGGPS